MNQDNTRQDLLALKRAMFELPSEVERAETTLMLSKQMVRSAERDVKICQKRHKEMLAGTYNSMEELETTSKRISDALKIACAELLSEFKKQCANEIALTAAKGELELARARLDSHLLIQAKQAEIDNLRRC